MATATAAVFANFLATFGLVPLYPQIAHDLGLSADRFGAFFLIQGGLNVVLQLPVGVVADRVGRRRVMAWGVFFMAAGQILRWLSTTPAIFAVSQVFIGLCGPFLVAAAYSAVADAYRHTGRAQAIGVVQSSANVGQAAGFLLAGLIAPWLGWRTFSLWLTLLPLVMLPFVLRLPEPRRPPLEHGLGRALAAAGGFMADPVAARISAVAGLNMGALLGATFLLPFIAQAGGLSTRATSLLLMPILAGSTVGGPLAGRWADRAGPRRPGLASVALAAAALAALGGAPFSLALAVPACFAVGLSASALLAVTSVAIADMANRRGEGTGVALGGIRIGQALGPTLAPVLVGAIYVREGQLPAFAVLAGALLVAGILVQASVPATVSWTPELAEVAPLPGNGPLA